MIVTRRGALGLIGGSALAGALNPSQAWAEGAQPQIGVVVKIGGIPWFNAMEVGIKKQGKADDANAWMVGPTSGSSTDTAIPLNTTCGCLNASRVGCSSAVWNRFSCSSPSNSSRLRSA